MRIEYTVDAETIPLISQEVIRFMNRPDTTYQIEGHEVIHMEVWDGGIRFHCGEKIGEKVSYLIPFYLYKNIKMNVAIDSTSINYGAITDGNLMDFTIVAKSEKKESPNKNEIDWYRPLSQMTPGTFNVAIKREGFPLSKIAEDLILYHIPNWSMENQQILICDYESDPMAYRSFTKDHPNVSLHRADNIPENADNIPSWLQENGNPEVIIMKYPRADSLRNVTLLANYAYEWKSIAKKKNLICIVIENAQWDIPTTLIRDTLPLYIGLSVVYDEIIIQEEK